MNQDIAQHFASIVTAEFPKHADMEDGDLCLYLLPSLVVSPRAVAGGA